MTPNVRLLVCMLVCWSVSLLILLPIISEHLLIDAWYNFDLKGGKLSLSEWDNKSKPPGLWGHNWVKTGVKTFGLKNRNVSYLSDIESRLQEKKRDEESQQHAIGQKEEWKCNFQEIMMTDRPTKRPTHPKDMAMQYQFQEMSQKLFPGRMATQSAIAAAQYYSGEGWVAKYCRCWRNTPYSLFRVPFHELGADQSLW